MSSKNPRFQRQVLLCRYATADWLETSTAADMDLRLYAVTDAGQNERCQRSNAEVIEAAIQGGATFIQLREKDAPGGVMLREAQAALAVCRRHGVSPHALCFASYVARMQSMTIKIVIKFCWGAL